MKRTYIIPTAKSIVLAANEGTLAATSAFDLSNEVVDEAKSRHQETNTSFWENWSE